MRSLNLYSNNTSNITSGNRKDYAFPVNNCTTIIITAQGSNLYINDVEVYRASNTNDYIITLGQKGLYKFNTELNINNSLNTGIIAYTQNVKSDKMIQIDQGRIVNSTLNLNITGAIKLHLIHDCTGDLYINNVLVVKGGTADTIVIDIGNDVDIINDSITIQNLASQTGYIIERLI